jgi:23S rRNA (adenine2030-N6)-methyltransferase
MTLISKALRAAHRRIRGRVMLSYQHGFHAGNAADVHKHALLAWMLDYLTRKDKPLSYLETHAGRGVYDLASEASVKTGEADAGITRFLAAQAFGADHPYLRAIAALRARHGDAAYPGSPAIARELLRPGDSLHLAELHPQEFHALRRAVPEAKHYHQDGFEMAQSICPPTPRRGLLLMDPSFEVKSDYQNIPGAIAALHRKWNVGIIALWYPILADHRHKDMIAALENTSPQALRHEVSFPAARQGHGMIGSGLFILNPPFGLEKEAAKLDRVFREQFARQ